jgi:pimeloyl-ACP methyl ester carboxylesterase
LRPDVLAAALGATPVLGDLLRHTLLPVLSRIKMPQVKRAMFAPAPVTPRFRAEFADALAVRPSQLRASMADGAMMIPSVLQLRGSFGALRMPVAILAGAGDRVVFARNAERLHRCLPDSTLRVLEGVGHMLHHSAPDAVLAAIETVMDRAGIGTAPGVEAASLVPQAVVPA